MVSDGCYQLYPSASGRPMSELVGRLAERHQFSGGHILNDANEWYPLRSHLRKGGLGRAATISRLAYSFSQLIHAEQLIRIGMI
jgi:hypothetical protein